jgi:hypothetical protein
MAEERRNRSQFSESDSATWNSFFARNDRVSLRTGRHGFLAVPVRACWGRKMECWLPLTGRFIGDMRSEEVWILALRISRTKRRAKLPALATRLADNSPLVYSVLS